MELAAKVRRLAARWRRSGTVDQNPMHLSEGHLGGYIRAGSAPTPSGLDIRNGDPETWSPALWRWAVERFQVRSVLDVGCGEGHAARYFRDLGCDVVGVDGSLQAHRDSRIPESHVVHDFNSGPYAPGRSFDLVWSCEFVEHVEQQFEQNFLRTFQAGEIVMMTFADPGQPGWHHVNCQNGPYWAYRLFQHGFELDHELTEQSRALSEGRHYRRSGLLFRRTSGNDSR